MVKRLRMVKECVATRSAYDLEGNVEDIIITLQELIENYGPTVSLDYEQCKWDDDYEFNVYIERPENDVERSKRLEIKKEQRARDEVWERRQYEKLKKKFGDTV